jgi:hypothetical protein
VLSICGNSYKTVGKAFQVKLVERMSRVCIAVIKAKCGYFEESKLCKAIEEEWDNIPQITINSMINSM